MLSDLEFVVTNLRNLQGGRYKEAEENLYNSMRTDPHITRILLSKILSGHHEDSVKMSAASLLNANLIELTGDSSENYAAVRELITGVIENPNVSVKCKPSLQRALTGIVDATCHSTLQSSIETTEWIVFTKKLFEAGLANPCGYMMMEAYSSAEMNESCFFEFFNDIALLSVADLAKPGKKPADIKEWGIHFYLLFERLEQTDTKQPSLVSKQLLADICNSQAIVELIMVAYKMGAQEPVLLASDYNINGIKFEVSSVHMAILCYLQHLEDSKDCEQLHLNLLFTCLPLFTATMKLMAEAPDEIKKRDNKAVEFVINIMKMFKIAIKMHRFSGLFHQQAKNMILLVLIPYLQTTENEIYTFEHDPQEYCSYADDIVDRQNSQTLKSEAAAIIEAFIDVVDGCATFVFHLALQSIYVNMELPPTQQPPLVLGYSQCFLLLALMSCQYTQRRKDLLEILKQFMRKHQQVVQRLNQMELVWYFIFMSYNFTDIFPDPHEGEHFIMHASSYTGHPTVVQASLDFISNITEDYYTDALFKSSCDNATLVSSTQLWDTFNLYVTKKFDNISEEAMMYLASKMFERINNDLDKIKQKRSKELMFILRSLGVLRGISINVVYLKDKPKLQERLWDVVHLLDTPRRLDYVNEVLNIIMMLLSYNKDEVLDRELQLLEQLAEVQKNMRYRTVFNPMFRILNLYITKMPPLQTQHTRLLFQLCLKTLNPQLHDTHEHDTVQGILLLQMFVKKFEQVICLEETKSIVSTVGSLNLKHKISYCRMVVLLVLLYPIELRQGIVQTNKFLETLLQNQEMFQTQYERKLLVMALCWAMPVETDMLALAEMINVCIRTLAAYEESSTKANLTSVENKEFELSVQKLKCDWHKVDIYQVFKERMQWMRDSNSILYDQIIKSLTGELSEQLRKISMVVTIGNVPRKIMRVNMGRMRQHAQVQSEYEHACHQKLLLEEEDSENKQMSDIEDSQEQGVGNRMKKRKL